MYRTVQEQRELTFEAERRVRAGEPQTEVARSLGIPTSTLAHWARLGGWRRKDLVAVRNESRGKMALELINELTAKEHEKRQQEVTKLREAFEASKAELETVAPGGRLPLLTGGGDVPAGTLAMAMADNLLRQGELEQADRAIRLAIRFREAEQAANAREETRWREERDRLMNWWAETQTAYHKLHKATDWALGEMAASIEKEQSRSADECCPMCGRRMDFWPEEVNGPEDEFESVESGAIESVESGSAEFPHDESADRAPYRPEWARD